MDMDVRDLLHHIIKNGYDEDYLTQWVAKIVKKYKPTKYRNKLETKQGFSLEDVALSYIITLDEILEDFIEREDYEICSDIKKSKDYIVAEFGRYKVTV